jgi:hypothetical protein
MDWRAIGGHNQVEQAHDGNQFGSAPRTDAARGQPGKLRISLRLARIEKDQDLGRLTERGRKRFPFFAIPATFGGFRFVHHRAMSDMFRIAIIEFGLAAVPATILYVELSRELNAVLMHSAVRDNQQIEFQTPQTKNQCHYPANSSGERPGRRRTHSPDVQYRPSPSPAAAAPGGARGRGRHGWCAGGRTRGPGNGQACRRPTGSRCRLSTVTRVRKGKCGLATRGACSRATNCSRHCAASLRRVPWRSFFSPVCRKEWLPKAVNLSGEK